jgi:uncharacterized membrane protein YgdD (TMEM256/DUF423 family)
MDKLQKKILVFTAVSGMLAVVLGAFGAHALADKLNSSQLNTYQTGIEYQFYHTFALFAICAFFHSSKKSVWLFRSALFFAVGIVLFSGSLYILACKEILLIESWTHIIGPLTPIGGFSFIVGWLLIIVFAMKEFNTDI